MQTEELSTAVTCTPSTEPKTTNSQSEFERNSNKYASLPNNKTLQKKSRQLALVAANLKNASPTENSKYCTESRRKRKSSNKTTTHLNDVNKMSSAQPYSILDESISREDSFGLSNNLSSESIRNACGYYEDELSDDDLIEIHSTPGCFQKRQIAQKAIKGSLEKCKKRKNSEENPLCNLSDKTLSGDTVSGSISTDDNENEAVSVLNELDAILDIHGSTQLSHSSPSFTNDIETKVEDCLLDLDHYLEELDDNSSASNYESDTARSSAATSQIVTKHHRNQTLPMKRKACFQHTEADILQRGHPLRKTISCTLERQPKDATAEHFFNTPESSSAMNSRWSSMHRIDQPMLFNSDEHDTLEASASTNTEKFNSIQRNCTDSMPFEQLLQTPRVISGEFRRCFSQRDFGTPHTNANDMLTQDDIFHNLCANLQTECNNMSAQRPRQFGRRAEGHPRVISLRTDATTPNNNYQLSTQSHRPMSAPATATANTSDRATYEDRHSTLYVGSEGGSSIRSSRNGSPISIVTSSDSCSTAVSTSVNIEPTLTAASDNLTALNNENNVDTGQARTQHDFNNEWPHSFSRTLALMCCSLGLFNICRFAVLTIHYGGNFLLQFLLLSILFGIPMFWLQMCLGAKIKSGPVTMWHISPICRGIGIALTLVQCFVAIYSTVAIAWLLVYLRDSFPSNAQTFNYRWQDIIYPRYTTTNSTDNLTTRVADYFNIVVLQRLQFARHSDGTEIRFRPVDRLAFNLAILWAAVFLILCKGLKSFGKIIFALLIIPMISLTAVTCKLLYVADLSKLQNIFSSTDFDDFLINSKTWTAAAQETFLTWGFLGASVIAVTSRTSANDNNKSTIRRDAILVVLLTLLGLSIAALMGLSCAEILNHQSYIYIPGSFERPNSYIAVYSLKSLPSNTNILSYPPKWVPHYSSFVGETYRRPTNVPHRESGYQALRFISELFPAAIALSTDVLSWVWTAIAFMTFILIGLAQLCVMWKPISSALGNSTSSVLLSCVAGLLLGIPFATEVGISILHYMDLLLGGSWFIPILWATQIFGVFLIRGRPYNGDDLVNDLKMSGSMSAFLALSWNVLLPIGLVTLAVINYKISLSSQFYYWRGKSYFSYWARKVAGLTQIGFLLLIPITAIIQIYRYLTRGPPDILDRIQLLYRPPEGGADFNRSQERSRGENSRRTEGVNSDNNTDLNMRSSQDDAPPKYTPPPSYTTATGARLAKILRQSIRRSVRRILGEPGRTRPNIPVANEETQNNLPPEYPDYPNTSRTRIDSNIQEMSETIEIGQRPTSNVQETRRTLSLGRKMLAQKHHWNDTTQPRPSSYTHLQRPYTAEDVVTVLRPSTSFCRQERATRSSRELHAINPPSESSFRSIENLILNAEPLGESPAIGTYEHNNDDNDNAAVCNNQNNTSVI